MSYKVKFWGVRGSIPTPSPSHMEFGGNTSCVELSLGGQRIILDCGTGLRRLGHHMLKKGIRSAHILQSHAHWDHICGFPFFSPAYHKDHHFTIMAGTLKEFGGIKKVLSDQLCNPTFPVPIEVMAARFDFEDFSAGEEFSLGPDIKVKTALLNHPGGATGYRVEHRGRSFCYITDTEHVPGHMDGNILGLIEGADLVAYDSTYTEAEFSQHVGWGHSTWEEAVKLARAANVKSVALFHHDPDHDDKFMRNVERQARKVFPDAFAAREGQRIVLV